MCNMRTLKAKHYSPSWTNFTVERQFPRRMDFGENSLDLIAQYGNGGTDGGEKEYYLRAQLTEVVVRPEARCGSGSMSLSSKLDTNEGQEREDASGH
jgi:hypothetical protein